MTALIETYRGGVTVQECDAFGHLNIAYYVERFADAAHELLQRAAPGSLWQTRTVATRYLTELRAGDPISIASGVIALDAASLTIGQVLSNGMGGEASTVCEQVLTLDAPDGEAWVETRDRLTPMLASWTHDRFAPVALPAGEGPLLAGLNRVKTWEADAAGRLSLFGFIERFSTANLVNMNAAGLTSAYMRAQKRGFATFETRLELLSARPQIGDTVAIQSGILELGNSSVKILHTMRLQRGRRVARFYQAGVHFDLEARRSAPLPQALRDKAREQLIRT
ncbi:MAG TPA: acyl-[acyl-carrier-protein] thioesterase [Stellaceae bacterium]|nr:acyl-[acyl-carrier-protein] thioesterase [Stellaceae bacterium]